MSKAPQLYANALRSNYQQVDQPTPGAWQFSIRPNASGSYDLLSSHPETSTWQEWPEHSNMALPDALQLMDDYRRQLGG